MSRKLLSMKPAPKDVYLGLRNLALQGSREKFGLPATSSPTEPWGALMDWNVAQATATVVAFSNGEASIYLSSGGGFIGGARSHESVRNAGKIMVAAAIKCQPQARATSEYPLPPPGQVFFYLLTDSGVFTASASEKDLSSHHHALSPLGDAAQNLITQYRLSQANK